MRFNTGTAGPISVQDGCNRGGWPIPCAHARPVDFWQCSLLTNSWRSNRYWSKRAPKSPSITQRTQSTWGISCNCDQGRTIIGRRVYSSSARCAKTAVSAELCCGRIAQEFSWRGTPTPNPRSSASVERRLRGRSGQSRTPATLRSVQNVWGGNKGTSCSVYYVNSDLLSRHNKRHRLCSGRPPPYTALSV